MKSSLIVAVALTVIIPLTAGCGGDPGTPGPTSAPAPATPAAQTAPSANPREEAAALVARGDYAAAELKYREALARHPDDFDLHFALASVLSQLDRRAEAIEEFRWVVKNGPPGRAEVESARRWLAEAETVAPAKAPANQLKRPEPPVLRAEPGASGAVTGRVAWPGIPDDRSFAVRVIVEGSGGRKVVRSKLNATYAVEDLPPGTYKLTVASGSQPIWKDLSVTVRSGEQTTLDLTVANAAVSPSDFPPR